MKIIKDVVAREIRDSRGKPTIETTVAFVNGMRGTAAVPSGASTGAHEARELRDADGRGVTTAVGNVNGEIRQMMVGKMFDQRVLDTALTTLDGTHNKSRLGANAILSVSLAFARAAAIEQGKELFAYIAGISGSLPALPTPALNIINGGKHADSGLDIQEFMIVPTGFSTFAEKVNAANAIIAALGEGLRAKGYSTTLGDEGGFAPKLSSNEEALELLVTAIRSAGYTTDQVRIAIDAAASTFYHDGMYVLAKDGKTMTTDEMIAWYEKLVGAYPIISIEDGLAEDDWEGFAKLTARIGDKVHIVGDDLTVTNQGRIEKAIDMHAINAVLIKLNQIGTLTETIDAVAMTKQAGWVPFVSHRSGETMDAFISDLAAGLSCPYIKAGSLTKPERTSKYERLVVIEHTLIQAAGVGIRPFFMVL